MKKIILLSFMLMFGFIAFSQTDSNLVTNSDTEKLIDKYSSKLEASLVSLGDSLKQPAEHVYSVLIKQQAVTAYSYLLLIVIFLIIIISMWIMWWFQKERAEWYGVPVVVTMFLFVFIAILTQHVLTGFINPEYGAMKEIVDMIK